MKKNIIIASVLGVHTECRRWPKDLDGSVLSIYKGQLTSQNAYFWVVGCFSTALHDLFFVMKVHDLFLSPNICVCVCITAPVTLSIPFSYVCALSPFPHSRAASGPWRHRTWVNAGPSDLPPCPWGCQALWPSPHFPPLWGSSSSAELPVDSWRAPATGLSYTCPDPPRSWQ